MKEAHKELIIDSGFLIALLNRKDQYHQQATQQIRSLSDRKMDIYMGNNG